MQKDEIIMRLKDAGCRITKQRLLLLDIILNGECTSCKDIYYQAARQDKNIGPATVYRMVKLLEDTGVINPKNLYRISCTSDCAQNHGCQIELSDRTIFHITPENHRAILTAGLQACGYSDGQDVTRFSFVAES